MDTVATEVTKAEALRALADWVEQHPDIKVTVSAGIYTYDQKEARAALAAAAPFDRTTQIASFPVVMVRTLGDGVTLDVLVYEAALEEVKRPITVTRYELPEELAAIAEGRA